MTKYLDLPVSKINELLKKKEIKVVDLINESFERIEKNSDLNCFITLNKEEALKEAEELDKNHVDSLLFGMPIIIKDNMNTKNLRTTAASKMLENFIPLEDADVVKKIKSKNMIIIGKANMDEFAMGSSNRTSYFGPVKNPWNKTLVPGGSSGGCAAAVSSRIAPFALGSDTGGSIRQPSSFCGTVGLKPTYGRVSRNGLIAFASSLDQIGPITRNVYENALLLNEIVGHSEMDLTSVKKEKEDFTRLIGKDISGMKIAIPKFFINPNIDKEVREKLDSVIDILKSNNCTVDYVDIKYIDQCVLLYQIIAMGEASSNLARFDGVRYGYSYPNPKNYEDLYLKTRKLGFGSEVKRRIMIGSYLLSGENAKNYYNKALQIRDDVRKNFLKVFEKYDLIIGPTTTTTAYPLEQDVDDAVKSFLDDVLTIPVNMAGLPAMSLPIGFGKCHLPIGMQIIAPPFEEAKIYWLGSFIEKTKDLDLNPKVGVYDE